MSVQIGWFTWRQQAGVASACIQIPQGLRYNMCLMKNEDTTNAIWVKIGDEIGGDPVAAVNQHGAGGSFCLAPGEAIFLPGLQISRVAFIAAAGTPYFKVLIYNATGQINRPGA